MYLQNGFEIHRGVFSPEEVESFRAEADRVAAAAGSTCVRHIRSRSRAVDELSISRRLLALVPDGYSPVRSILFDKTPEQNWPVAWHQDLTIAVRSQVLCEGYGPWSAKEGIPHVRPPVDLLARMVTARIHLDETPADNGALMIVPGSHTEGRISADAIASRTEAESVHVCECRPGDVLLMSPLVLHASRRSASPARRRILHFEYADRDSLDSRLSWHELPGASA